MEERMDWSFTDASFPKLLFICGKEDGYYWKYGRAKVHSFLS
jgi:hypothetical protein